MSSVNTIFRSAIVLVAFTYAQYQAARALQRDSQPSARRAARRIASLACRHRRRDRWPPSLSSSLLTSGHTQTTTRTKDSGAQTAAAAKAANCAQKCGRALLAVATAAVVSLQWPRRWRVFRARARLVLPRSLSLFATRCASCGRESRCCASQHVASSRFAARRRRRRAYFWRRGQCRKRTVFEQRHLFDACSRFSYQTRRRHLESRRCRLDAKRECKRAHTRICHRRRRRANGTSAHYDRSAAR